MKDNCFAVLVVRAVSCNTRFAKTSDLFNKLIDNVSHLS